jgi:hypothetical protein
VECVEGQNVVLPNVMSFKLSTISAFLTCLVILAGIENMPHSVLIKDIASF